MRDRPSGAVVWKNTTARAPRLGEQRRPSQGHHERKEKAFRSVLDLKAFRATAIHSMLDGTATQYSTNLAVIKLAAEIYPADRGDSNTLRESIVHAQKNLIEVDSPANIEEVVADKGYHAAQTLAVVNEMFDTHTTVLGKCGDDAPVYRLTDCPRTSHATSVDFDQREDHAGDDGLALGGGGDHADAGAAGGVTELQLVAAFDFSLLGKPARRCTWA